MSLSHKTCSALAALLAMALTFCTARADLIDYSGGFPSTPPDLTRNGNAQFVSSVARLTDGGFSEAGSVFSNSRCTITNFTTTFTFQLLNGTVPSADGITFTVQGNSPTALGPGGGGLGYGPDILGGPPGIPNSVAIKFDLYNNAGEGINSTGLFTNGHSPTIGVTPPDVSIDLTGTPIDLHSQHTFRAVLDYDGTTLGETITDLTTSGVFNHSYTIDISSFVGGDTAYVGFTGGTGGLTATQDIHTWRFEFIPEPSSLALLGLGSLGLIGYRWRRRKLAA